MNLTTGSSVPVWTGGGEVVDALEVDLDGKQVYLAGSTPHVVADHWGEEANLNLNHAVAHLGTFAWGQCWRVGDVFVGPFKSSSGEMTATVLKADTELTMDLIKPTMTSAWGSEDEGTRYLLTWTEHSPFVNRLEVFVPRGDKWEPMVVHHATRASGPVEASWRSEWTVPPRPILTGDPCWIVPDRHPDFSGLHAVAEFSQYREAMRADEELMAYLAGHPKACAVLISYEIVDEPNSTAYVWSTRFSDPGGDAYHNRWVLRCHGGPMALLPPDCDEHERYGSETIGPYEDEPRNTTDVVFPAEIRVVNDRVTDVFRENFTRFIWRAYERGDRDQGIFSDLGSGDPAPHIEVDFGTLEGYVDYRPVGPPASVGGRWSSDSARLHNDGWIGFAGLDLMNPPVEA